MDRDFSSVGHDVEKIDGLSLATGTGRYTDDFDAPGTLHVAVLYSPHAHGIIKDIDDSEAWKVPGVVDVMSYKNAYDDMPKVVHTTAGQGFPEPSPYDSWLFDDKVRFAGDRVAAVAAETLDIAREAVSKIKVEYELQKPLFDPERAMDPGVPVVHDRDEYMPIPVPYDPSKNLMAEKIFSIGDVEKGLAEADIVLDQVYHTHYAHHCMMEPHSAFALFDETGRMIVYSSTSVPFHVRRIVAQVLDYPLRKVHVIKPRVGGAYGGKQEAFIEPLAAKFALRTGRPVKAILSREEVFTSSRTRHPMRVHVTAGVMKDGTITALRMDDLMTAGAYGPHGLTVLCNAASKVLPLFNKVENVEFIGRTVYTNQPVGGAYRGYGVTQATFGFMQFIDDLTRRLDVDILEYVKKWHIKEGEGSPVFEAIGEGKAGVPQVITCCKLSECIDRGAEAIGWSDKRGRHISNSPGKVRGVGMAVSMQGSGIPLIDMGSAYMKLNEDGSCNLLMGASDTGTGSDTVMCQIAAEVLDISTDMIVPLSSDTDVTPFDVGAYASSGTYVSGGAVRACAEDFLKNIMKVASVMLEVPVERLDTSGGRIWDSDNPDVSTDFGSLCCFSLYGAGENMQQIQGYGSYTSPVSPPPFIAQFAEVEVDTFTGRVEVLRFVSAVDCGKALNPKMTEGQVEGGVLNGIGYALTEQYLFDDKGRMTNPDFGNYKVFGSLDVPKIETILVDSYEETGPFGAKSVSEVCINGPAPAIANAIYDAVGVRIFDLPLTSEKVLAALKDVDR
ncbi:molybdopterin-dependent oxidoreductase [Dethiosulfovibrio sp. F2B]|uniref:xanthine dehydrogenase family protein molybdopterin-binding subunit n=1 Tax=Dethiosulfovibrio faecalis TaxID=2720018 RepID=UPI001F483998|nr:molybdopterin cofactor-binding domain-containing protein [Dethiosulfovibrio faecalis]MCF4151176.1 molybdopterin-dependent oxidoreductase [Dethiosulfovibrio faecalis]